MNIWKISVSAKTEKSIEIEISPWTRKMFGMDKNGLEMKKSPDYNRYESAVPL